MKRLLISRDRYETRVALLEDGRLAEFLLERPGDPSLVGNIYKGRVQNVLAGMDAAFVDIGKERNGYLCVDEVLCSETSPGRPRRITELLRSGKELLVQVTRDGIGGKGPRLTTQIGLAGRFAVFMPRGSNCGVSRRLDAGERERLRALCNSLKPEAGGLIVRTAAEGATADQIERDLRFLQRVWAGVERRVETESAPALVYRESDLATRVVRDLMGADVEEVVVDDAQLHRRLRNYVRAITPDLADRVILYRGSGTLFGENGVDAEARRALGRHVDLPSGGYIVVDHTEAMTVIDVNTGRFVGKRFLEDTTLKTNLEACREIVRQLRLRDIGGIIVIDFIDMTAPANQEAVLKTLEAELARDRTKTYVVELSPLGLVEMTRQSVTRGLRDIVMCRCPMCHGEGRVLSDESALIAVERRLADMATASTAPGLRVEVHPRMVSLLRAGHPSRLEQLERRSGRFFILLTAEGSAELDHVALVPD
jgi:ribonuclease G